jgi:hypothetical protein
VVFGLVGTLVGLIALSAVAVVNCARLGIGVCRPTDDPALALLPSVSPAGYLVRTNPGSPGGLAADLSQLLVQIPAADQARVQSFTDGARYFVARLPDVRGRAECGYRPGEPAVRLYQDRAHPWSVGLAVVIPGTLVDVFDTPSACFLGHRTAAMVNLAAVANEPAPAFCDAQPLSAGGADFTLLTLGSTVDICAGLTGRPTVPVRTRVDAAVRPDAAPTDPASLTAGAGSAGTAVCHRATGAVTWIRVTFPAGTADPASGKSTEDEYTGYVAATDLDPSVDLVALLRPCPADTTFDPLTVAVGDCVANRGSEARPEMRTTSCSDPTGYRVIAKAVGPSIPETPGRGFDEGTARTVCAVTGYDTWYGSDQIDNAKDVFLCLKEIRP